MFLLIRSKNMGSRLQHSKITGKTIGACMRVHSELGNGFQEKIYQRSLAIELQDIRIYYQRELVMPLYYKKRKVGTRRVDFMIEKKVLLELKAVSVITAVHHAQILNYLKAYKLRIGLLINFGEESLRF